MKSIIAIGLVLTAVLFGGVSKAQPKVLRAGEMTSKQWAEVTEVGMQNVIVEFRQGDEIPVTLNSEGDLLETVQSGVSYVKVKQSFWLQLHQDKVEISLDGASFKQLNEVVSGSFSAGAGANAPGVPVNAISLLLKAFLK